MRKVVKVGVRKISQAEVENALEYAEDLYQQAQGFENMVEGLDVPNMLATEAGNAVARFRNIITMLKIQL